MMVFNRNLLFQGAIFRFHVKPWEGTPASLFSVKVCPSESPNTSITSTIQRMAFLREAFALEVSVSPGGRGFADGSHPFSPPKKNRVF